MVIPHFLWENAKRCIALSVPSGIALGKSPFEPRTMTLSESLRLLNKSLYAWLNWSSLKFIFWDASLELKVVMDTEN